MIKHVYLDSRALGSKYPSLVAGHVSFESENATTFAIALEDQQATGATLLTSESAQTLPLSELAQQVPIVGVSILKYSGTIFKVEKATSNTVIEMRIASFLISGFAPALVVALIMVKARYQ
jgi:hypothetical protein